MQFLHLHSIADLFHLFQLPQNVRHPLVAIIDFTQVKEHAFESTKLSTDFYTIIFKNYAKNNLKYGRKPLDFQNGSLICLAPNQVIEMDAETEEATDMQGWGLCFHPDFIRGTTLLHKMKEYHFFSYDISEALHLSEKEKEVLNSCIQKIESELKENIDVYSQSIIVSTIELLLNYCSRFYGRQFITRKSANNFVVAQIDALLSDYFIKPATREKGIPTVNYLAEQVHLSPNYLSDLLKKETGRNAQEHIHFYLIETAKDILISTDKTINEISYSLGFNYPQYFNKLFKQKTGYTPVEYRSLN